MMVLLMGSAPDRKGAFFGRRKGRRLRPQQAALFDTLLPKLALDLSASPQALRSLFPGPTDEVRLEIGCGGGEHLVLEATDIADYAAWTLKHVIRSADFAWTAERADDWRHAWPGFAETRYEAKAKRAGRRPCYLIFRRTEGGGQRADAEF